MPDTAFAAFNEHFYNPILEDANDPWITSHGGLYYYCKGMGTHIEIVRSPTLTGIGARQLHAGSVRAVAVLPEQTELWAPELHFYGGHWYILYTADYNHDTSLHRMHIIRSETDDPMGEWGTPVRVGLPGDLFAIDGTFFQKDDGRLFMIWSGWRTEREGQQQWIQSLFIVELDAADPSRAITTKRISMPRPRFRWETSITKLNEGPCIVTSPRGTVYCLYSGNSSGSAYYTIGTMRLKDRKSPLNPDHWEKLSTPVLALAEAMGIFAPGHPSVTKSPDGSQDWMAFHTSKAMGSAWDRTGRILPIDWAGDRPNVAMQHNDTLLPLPSGESVHRIMIQAEDGALSGAATVEAEQTTSGVVRLADDAARIAITVSVPEDGAYPLAIRFCNPGEGPDAFRLRANDGVEQTLTAQRTGGPGLYGLRHTLVDLTAGQNTIEIAGPATLSFDLFILDMTPLS